VRRTWLPPIIALLAVAAPLACGQTAPPVGAGALEHIPHLTVRGTAQLEMPADQLRITLGVVTEADDAAEALARNTERMNTVMKSIRQAGLEDGEYETGRFSVQPMYTRRPRGADADWRPQIIGYRVSNSINIKTKKLKMAGTLIDEATDAGANSVDSISFDLADPRTHREEAIRTATHNAITDAHILADSATLELVRVLRIELDATGREPYMPMARGMGGAMEADMARAPTPITPGDVTVRATVDVVYEIASRN
jgi:uncharacterized protein YggE